jgi:hypothetical protein
MRDWSVNLCEHALARLVFIVSMHDRSVNLCERALDCRECVVRR